MSQPPPPTPEELILAMLRDVLARQARQMGVTPPVAPPTTEPAPPIDQPPTPLKPPESPIKVPAHITLVPPISSPTPQPKATVPALAGDEDPLSLPEQQELAEYEDLATQSLSPSSLSRTLRLAILTLFVLLVLINLPIFNGLALARALPDRQALIIRDGLLLKGSGPEVYVLQENHKRWISSLDAFKHYGYNWDEVHVVEDSYLNQFPDGRPLHVLLKCDSSPHIYRLENDRKRWIKDISTFTAEGHVWEDVRFVTCGYLRPIPDGPSIPPEAGPPPQP